LGFESVDLRFEFIDLSGQLICLIRLKP